MTDWFESKTPVGNLACRYCRQNFNGVVRFQDHMIHDHRVAQEVDARSAYPKALLNAAYGRLRLVR